MNAPAKPLTETQTRQSLAAKWQEGRHELLQLYADLELVLATRLVPDGKSLVVTPPDVRSFGKKVQHAIKTSPAYKMHAELVPLRNLLAHAKLEVVTLGDELAVILRVADLGMAMNARVISEKECKPLLSEWRNMLKQAIAHARDLPVLRAA